MLDTHATDVARPHLTSDPRAVMDLRAAALEAGISARAFDTALAEMQQDAHAGLPATAVPARRVPRRWIGGAAAAIIAAGIALVIGSRAPDVPTVTETFALRCVPAQAAAELLRADIGDPAHTMLSLQNDSPNLLSVRTTPAELANVRAAIARIEGASPTAACPAR